MISVFLSGVFMMGLAVSALVFLRLWSERHDEFFLLFSLAFWLMALERLPLALFHQMKEPGNLVYLLRLTAFLLILEAIRRKNVIARRPKKRPLRGRTSA